MNRINNLYTLLIFSLLAVSSVLCLVSCEDKEEVIHLYTPTLTAPKIVNVSKTTATVSAVITSGGNEIVERGFCYNTEGNPTIDDSIVVLEDGLTVLDYTFRDLAALTTYYTKTYLKLSTGDVYYSTRQVSFTTGFYQTPTALVNRMSTRGSSIEVEAFVVSDELSPITKRGIIVSPTADKEDEMAQAFVDPDLQSGTFIITATALEPETEYYVWPFVETEAEIVYSATPKITTTLSAVLIKGITAAGTAKRIGSHSVHLDVQVTDVGAPNATISEAGIAWSKTAGVDLEANVLGKQIDTRITELEVTYQVGAADLERNTSYYFRPFMKNSNGKLIYGVEQMLTTQDNPLLGSKLFYKNTEGNNLLSYTVETTNVWSPFQLNDSEIGLEAFQEAFASKGYTFDGKDEVVFVLATTAAEEKALTFIINFHNKSKRAYFGFKVDEDLTAGTLTFSDMVYAPENFPTLTSHNSNATELMNDPVTGAFLDKYLTWATGTKDKQPRRVLVDWFTNPSSIVNGGIIIMPLDKEVNPNMEFFRVRTNKWGQPAATW